MNLSYWEYKTWLSNIDYTIIGSGIVGLNCAVYLKEQFPKAKILVLERGLLPQGASTKNAGFACFGSISEVLSDLKMHSEEEVRQLVQKRLEGIQLLRENLGDEQIDYQNHGGHEVYFQEQEELFEDCLGNLEWVNSLLNPVFKTDSFQVHPNSFNFEGIQKYYITNPFEGQINTGKMMKALLDKVQNLGVTVLNAIGVEGYVENMDHVAVKTDHFEFKTHKLFIATNGFASQLIGETVRPARAQVLITKPINNLNIKGTFHLEEGYYYFRNIDNRILLGGGRNLDFKGEETSSFGETALIQNRLEHILHKVILPNTSFDIDLRWSGIMGMGKQKKPIVKQLGKNVYCGVRMGGMGIAIGSLVGKELANLMK
ncbi:FAD-dependent oxidoreductase [Arenibacter sp. M-2]|uniref:NAD(P)/FAD-dependent oxidoreductase n=1 Tax=unclassified Arenibacter TaxID=2615047 RepID=UPI000D77116A|nr:MULTISPECIES: FAD-dependent oxidoreductase [unclassified Arenibacter]MDL5510462.1 FAD-dependent oxidoreductase [Arenibacter sp. M-2]PXX31335.1 glycine/D-amino acid oxidase-like deaminating enzyme [Arenibacter sp. ARW7G5Y1]